MANNAEMNLTSEKKSEWMFYVGFALLCLNTVISTYIPLSSLAVSDFLSKLFVFCALMILLIRFVIVSMGRKVPFVLLSFVILCLSVVSYVRSGQMYLPSLFLCIFSIGSIDVRNFLFKQGVCVLSLLIFLACISVVYVLFTGDKSFFLNRSDTSVQRFSFGFTHPNMFSVWFVMCILAISAKHKFNTAQAFICIFAVLFLSATTNSKTAMIVLVFYVVFSVLAHIFKSRIVLIISICLFGVLVFFSYILMAQGDNSSLYSFFQTFITGRPGYWNLQYETVGVTFFGQKSLVGTVSDSSGWIHTSVTIDNAYVSMMVQLGVWALFVFAFVYIVALVRAEKKNDLTALVLLATCTIVGFTEIHLLSVAVCAPILLISSSIDVSANYT